MRVLVCVCVYALTKRGFIGLTNFNLFTSLVSGKKKKKSKSKTVEPTWWELGRCGSVLPFVCCRIGAAVM